MFASKRILLLAVCVAVPCWAATVTIDPVARSLGTGRDSVPGRDAPYVFWGESDTRPPVINNAGEVVFRAKSASLSNVSTGAAYGIYVKRPGEPLAVLMDTTVDAAGNPTFPVPGQPSDTQFLISLLGAPLINDAGDVVFFARFSGPTSGTGEGFYATNTSGGPIVKIVDTTDPVPGHPTAFFVNFRFISDTLGRMAISLNDLGEVVYWAQFCLETSCTSATNKNGIFGTTVTGASPILLADSTQKICPTGIPFGVTCDPALDQGFWEIRPEKGITNTGDVIFHGKIRRSGSSCCAGVFSVPVTGGVITTAAFRTQPAPPDGTISYSDRFDEVAHNEAGTVLFLPLLGFSSPARFGIYAGDLTGGAQVRIADTVPGTGPAVPGDPPDGEFTSLAFPTMNDAGQLGFRAMSNNSLNSNNDGIYAADTSGGPIRLVLDEMSTAPGLPDPARVMSFQESTGVAMNADGHMAFAGMGLDHLGNSLKGIYFYDRCAAEVTRIADSTTSLADLGGSFGSSGTQEFEVYTRGEARAGQYRSMNNSNQVAFTAQFSSFDFGVYVAHVSDVGGGPLTIACPDDLVLECPAETSPSTTGEATADGCGTITISSTDASTPGCGSTETITRSWSAVVGSGDPVSCDQTITVEDTTAPTLSAAPADVTVECDAVPEPATLTATDACDPAPAITFTEVQTDGTCSNEYVLTLTWTATDVCGNEASESQVVSVVDTTSPVVTCPLDVPGLECPADTTVAACGSATAEDNCGAVTLGSSDISVPTCGGTETITRTWTGTDECGNFASCDQTVETVDTVAPTIAVDTTPILVVDTDCSGDEAVTLPTATAEDDCDGSITVTHDAPAMFPAGETTTVTYTATDTCGNAETQTVDVTVRYGADILVVAALHTVGSGSYPASSKQPLVGIEVCAYDKSEVGCPRVQCGGISHHYYSCIASTCDRVSCCTTDASGECVLDVPPGDFLIIADDPTGTILPDPLGATGGELVCGDFVRKFLQQIVKVDSKKVPGKTSRQTGSELLIIEPEFVVWDSTEQLYPFVFESVGDWGVTVTVTPPEGFIADYNALSEDVDNELEAVQFTITEVGSDLVPTGTTFRLRHNGRLRTVHSEVGIMLTPDYARARGFNVAELRGRGLIVKDVHEVRRATSGAENRFAPARRK